MEHVPRKLLNRFTPRSARPWLDRLWASSLGRRMARGVFWSTAGAVVSRLLALLASIVTARILGKEVFGELGIIQSSAAMFGSIGSFGMGLTATKYVAQFRVTDPPQAGRIIGMSRLISWASGSLMALAVAALSPWLAAHMLAAPQLSGLLRVGALCVLFNIVSEAQLGSLSGFEAFKRRSTIQVTAGVASFPIAVASVYWWGLTGAIWAVTVSQGVLVCLNVYGIRKEARQSGVVISWRVSSKEMRVLWEFSLPTLLGAAIYVPAMWVANAILVNQPNGYGEMGIFSAADRWRTAIMFLPGLLGGVALPMLSSLHVERNVERYCKVLWTNVKVCSGLALAVAVPIALLAPWIMASYGPEFVAGKWVLVGLCALAVITSSYWILGQSLISQGRMWLLLTLNVGWATLLIGSCWLLRSKGAYGLVLAYLLADSVRFLAVLVLAKHLPTQTTHDGRGLDTDAEAKKRAFGGVLVRRERWVLSFRGTLLFFCIVVVVVCGTGRGLYPFLAITSRTSREIMVVEGWIHGGSIEQVAHGIRAANYQHVIVVNAVYSEGNKWESGRYKSEYIEEDLVRQGVPRDRVHLIYCNPVRRDRTYESAKAVKNWLQEHRMSPKNLDIVTLGPHARRSRLLFQKAFGAEAKVGVIATEERVYDHMHWWRSSEGVREVLFEGVAYLYVRFLFSPD